MALSSDTNRVESAALSSVSAGQLLVTFPSRISAYTDLVVTHIPTTGSSTTLTLDTHYTLDPQLESNSTLITSVDIKAAQAGLDAGYFGDGSVVVVNRQTNYLQQSNYEPNAVIPADTLENDFDKLTMQTQQLKADIGRSVRFSDTLLADDIPSPVIFLDSDARANKVLGFDADGEFAATQELGSFVGDWTSGTTYQTRDIVRTWGNADDDNYGSLWIAKQTHVAAAANAPDNTAPLASNDYWELILDTGHFATQADVAATNANTSESKATEAKDWANKTNGDVVVDEVASGEYSAKAYAIGGTGVDGNAGSAKDWAIKTDDTVDGTNYSAKYWATQEDVGTVATNISDISAVAAIDTDVTAVAAIDTAVSAVNANATNINTVAGQITPTNNVSTVAGVSADITTVAGQISPTNNISTVAGIDSDIQTVAGISSNVTTVAGISADVTTVAGDSADIQTVATNILDVNNFADTYLGALASDPSTTLDGALYFNTTSNELRVYDLGTTTWIPITSPPQPLDTTDSPTFAGVTVTTADINGGTIDGTDVTVGAGKTLDVSGGTLTTSTAQKEAIVDGGKGNLTASDVGLGNVTNESKATMFTDPTFTGTVTLASGSGINFYNYGAEESPDNTATDVTSNLLDDYEEGTWTPTVDLGLSSVGYGPREGTYTKVGNIVTVSCVLSITAGSPSGSTLRVGGFPFDAKDLTNEAFSSIVKSISVTSNGDGVFVYMNKGSLSDTAYFAVQTSTGTGGFSGYNFGSTGSVSFSLTYIAA